MNTPENYGFEELFQDDIMMLEAMLRSPAFGALKRALDVYRKRCLSSLLTAKDLSEIAGLQGRIIGVNAIENLPVQLVNLQVRKNANSEKEKSLKTKTAKPKLK